jgi:hypothetical protein
MFFRTLINFWASHVIKTHVTKVSLTFKALKHSQSQQPSTDTNL